MFGEIVPTLIPKTVQIVFLDGNRTVSSGTGFFFCNYVVTCHHVYWGPENTEAIIRFHDASPDDPRDGVRLSYRDLLETIVGSSSRDNFDYAVLNIPAIPKD